MARWRREYGRRSATAHTLAICDRIEADLRAAGHAGSAVASVRIGAGDRDQHDFEVEVEILPGVMIATRYQSVDEEGRDPDDLENEGGAVAWLAVVTAKEFLEMGPDFADFVHGLRVRIRQAFASWSNEGIDVTFGDLRFVRTEFWHWEKELLFEVRFRGLDMRLRPRVHVLVVRHPEELDAELEHCRPVQGELFAARTAYARQGADGSVDQLTLNAIARYGEVGPALRRTAWLGRLWLAEHLELEMQQGRIVSSRRHAADRLGWNGNLLTISGECVPESLLVALRGRPVTALVEQPLLSGDMVIIDACSGTGRSTRGVSVTIEQPVWLFCSSSGRVWLPDPGVE